VKLHDLLAKVLRTRDIVKPVHGVDTLYLRRFYICVTPWFSVFLHYIARSDDDRHCHDHPWDFWTLILRNGYLEEIRTRLTRNHEYDPRAHVHACPRCGKDLWVYDGPNDDVCPNPRSMTSWEQQQAPVLLFRKAEHTHRVNITPSLPAWTLVVAKPARRVWGFWTAEGWIDWRCYLGLPASTPDHREDVIREKT
jgi:hypothetical protein